ncbi:MAG: MFS transporter [Alicyclobacillaceae bacterium]|nr:MFS transporter [Alicyclobacillaceae bacterium]
MNEVGRQQWDTSYEWKAVLLLSIGFGLVGLDRWIITPLFPVFMHDLNMNYQDLGMIVATLAIFWGAFAVIMGGVSDKVGRRKVLIPAAVVFSLMSCFTGLANGLIAMLVCRALMGTFEGAFTPTAVACTTEASKPSRRGFNMGFQQCMFAFLGLGLGPIIATQLLRVVPSWRWVFGLVAIPGLIIAFLLFRVIREPLHLEKKQPSDRRSWFEVFRYRNVILTALGLFGAMTGIFVLSAMVPNYLTDYVKLSVSEMGFVTSALGFGGTVGYIAIPALSDKIGRKVAVGGSFIAGMVFLLLFRHTGHNPTVLFIWLFLTAMCVFASLCLMAGPIVAESVPPALVSSAAGIPIGVGEIFGGGALPGVAGFVAQHFGIQSTPYLALAGLIFGFIVCLFLKESAPIKQKAQLSEFGTSI